MALWTVRTALERARSIMQARATDVRLTAAEQAQAAETVNQIDLTLNALRPDDTVRPNQRAGRVAALRDRCFAVGHLDELRGLSAGELYDAIDLLDDVGRAIEVGEPGFISVLSDGV